MRVNVLLDFKSKMTEAALAQFAANVLTRMKDNPKFAAVKTLIETDLKDATDRYHTALQEAADRSRVKVAEKHAAQERLIAVLEIVAAHLNIIANNEESVVLEAGFNLRQRGQRHEGDLEPVVGLRADSIAPGQVTMEFDKVPHAYHYSAEWSADGNDPWSNGTYNTAAKIVLNNLPSRQDVWVRVCALGSQQRKSQPCQPVKVFVR